MKFLLLTTVFFLFSFSLTHAQAGFEGMIRYKASPEKDFFEKEKAEIKDSMEINIWFTKGKILIRNLTKSSEEDILVLIDSAKIYTINREDETYRVKKLRERKVASPPEVIQIAGYRSSPVQYNADGFAFGGAVNTTIWYADSLLFSIPEKYDGNEELMIIRNGHIMLKAEITTDFNPHNFREFEVDTLPTTEEKTTIIASSVIPGGIKPEDFIIPANFKIFNAAIDSAVDWDNSIMADTTHVPVAPPPPKKAPATHKKPAPKAVKSMKQSIRKEN